jgi:uncharacterized protein (DUF427 family)
MSESAPGFEKHPDYRVEIHSSADHVRVLVGDTTIADTKAPLQVTESRHHPVWYVPMADVDASVLRSTDHSTYCPFKGHASYWSITTGENELENVVWGYLDPYTECEPLKDHVAFYTDRVALEVNASVQESRAPGWSD